MPALTLFALVATLAEPRATVERRLATMGTELVVTVAAADRPAALAASEAAVVAIEATAARLSTWGGASELAALNQAPASQLVQLSPATWQELAAARRCFDVTGGAFDPGIGGLLAAWQVRGAVRRPPAAARVEALAQGGIRHLELLPRFAARRTRPGLVIDEGAFGKGAALDRGLAALDGLPGAPAARLDLGGQVAVRGFDTAQPVPLAHPTHRHQAVLELALATGSVATTGNSERGVVVGGERLGHVFDPATGEPAADFGSLVVVAPTALGADCLSTGLYVKGPDAALAWAAAHPGIEVVVLEAGAAGLRVRATAGLAGRLRPLLPGLAIELVPGPRTSPSTLAASPAVFSLGSIP